MLEEKDILSIIASELDTSDIITSVGKTSLEESLDIYLGNPNGYEVEGRSQVMSTDVADAIEWIMPQIMKSFTQNNEIVVFDPVHDGDERQAELESEYVYEILMKQNDGFIILHQFVKDALMQRNGIIKTYYAVKTNYKVTSYTGISEQQLQQILMAPEMELLEKSEYIDENATQQKTQQIQAQLQNIQQQSQQMLVQAQQQGLPQEQIAPRIQQVQQQVEQLQEDLQKPVMLYDVRISAERKKGQIYVDPVPREEFRVNTQHNSINLDNARFTAHVVTKTVSDVIDEYGLSLEETKELNTGNDWIDKDYRFAAQDETTDYNNDSLDESQREIEVSECFLKIDIEETGIAKLMKITVAGGATPTKILLSEEIDCMPWVATTTFLMSHKFEGLSMTDRLKELQLQKTTLWRNMLDNIYLQNNQRNVVLEGQVNMDDLMVSRPGGIIRAKRLDAITPLITPQVGSDAFTMMEYLDRVRAGRSGVDADGNATPENIGDRVGSQGIDRLMNAKEELVGLIIRVVAETGIKPLCTKIRDLSIQHVDSVQDFKFRGLWQKINPAQWMDRTRCTVRVGTGSGNQAQKLASMAQIMEYQKILSESNSPLVDMPQGYNALDEFCKLSGHNSAVRFFVDPMSPEGKEARQKMEQKQAEMEGKADQMNQSLAQSQAQIAQAEMAKVKVQQENNQLKAQADQVKNQLVLQKQATDAQISSLKAQLDEYKVVNESNTKLADLQFKYDDLKARTALELTRIEADKESEQNENYKQNAGDVSE